MLAFDLTLADGLALLAALAVLVLPMALAWWLVWRSAATPPEPRTYRPSDYH
ncbi:MAG: hypothetical protein LWW82_10725 [Comamonadaceae bacterium]|jgi:hypothetical protein|nr:hypothetical protein [Comamonadaceae bacterium]